MEKSENLKNFLKLVSDEKSDLLEKIRWRIANQEWLNKSGAIALRVLTTLKEKNMSQKTLAEMMNVSPQQVNKIVKGSENLTLETITKLEQALDIQLINIIKNYKNQNGNLSIVAEPAQELVN
ncbi:MAG: helix-turn-helix transcriptional regulator [Bacteroidota bacterium]